MRTGASDATLALLAAGRLWDGLRSYVADRREKLRDELELSKNDRDTDMKLKGGIEEIRKLEHLPADLETFIAKHKTPSSQK